MQMRNFTSSPWQLILNVEQESVHQVRVPDHNRDLGEHRLEADVQILDGVGREVIILEHLHGILGHPVRFQRQESLGSLRRV